MENKKIRVAVLFGGRSSEHEISIISALEMMEAADTRSYELIPVYVTIDGRWLIGEGTRNRDSYKKINSFLATLTEVTLLPKPQSRIALTVLSDSEEREIPIDVFFPLFHGQFGEDGCIQGLFELADVPYVGCGVMSAAVTMNKYVCKKYLEAHGIPVIPATTACKADALKDFGGLCQRIADDKQLGGFPLFVKPCNMGSSVGIGKAQNLADLEICLARVFRYDHRAIVERCVSDLFEINVSVKNENDPIASVVEVPAKTGDMLTYEDKYLKGAKKGSRPSQGMASLVRSIDPEDLPPDYKQKVREYAVRAYSLLECAGIARLDFIVDKTSGQIYFNEINSPPGSMAHYLWAKSRPIALYTQTFSDLVDEALASFARKLSLQREVGFKALA